MNCPEARDRLSAYHDSELPPDEAALVAAHVASCRSCARESASFEQVSGLSRRLTDPPVPAHLWDDLRCQLDERAAPKGPMAWLFPGKAFGRQLALAATVLVAVGIGSFSYVQWASRQVPNHLAANFAEYLDAFAEDPYDAQQILLASYDGRPVAMEEAADIVGYQPLAGQRLPPGWSVDKTYVLEMPCCTCAQVVCQDAEGNPVAIFEHDIDQPIWFGDRPTIDCQCENVPTSVTQFGEHLAASWKEGPRHITVIGATDLDVVTDFVAHMSQAGTPVQ